MSRAQSREWEQEHISQARVESFCDRSLKCIAVADLGVSFIVGNGVFISRSIGHISRINYTLCSKLLIRFNLVR